MIWSYPTLAQPRAAEKVSSLRIEMDVLYSFLLTTKYQPYIHIQMYKYTYYIPIIYNIYSPLSTNNHPQQVSLLGRCIWNNNRWLWIREFHKYAAVIVHPLLFWVKKEDEILPKYITNTYVCIVYMKILDMYMINYMFCLHIDISLPLSLSIYKYQCEGIQILMF